MSDRNQPRLIGDNFKQCRECRRIVRYPGGLFPDFAAYEQHLREVGITHGLEYVTDHPSLLAALDQADAACRDEPGGTS